LLPLLPRALTSLNTLKRAPMNDERTRAIPPIMHRDTALEVLAPARLHLGFLELGGDSVRRFGSLGFAIEAFPTIVRVAASDTDALSGSEAKRAADILARLRARFAVDRPVSIEVRAAPPAHAGLGSGTQLALALGTAVTRLSGLDVSPRRLAHALERGARSGVGIAAFEHGGFVVDAGSGPRTEVPPMLARLAFPEPWRVLLMLDPGAAGLHGALESTAFDRLAPEPPQVSAELCRLTLLGVLPGLVEHDLAAFGAAVTEIQAIVGDHFAPAQGGRFLSPRVARALAWLRSRGVACVGQSSWGPTGFAVVADASDAQAHVEAWRREHGGGGLEWQVCTARNRGAHVSSVVAHRARAGDGRQA
jgi:beta-RFAP synthase